MALMKALLAVGNFGEVGLQGFHIFFLHGQKVKAGARFVRPNDLGERGNQRAVGVVTSRHDRRTHKAAQ